AHGRAPSREVMFRSPAIVIGCRQICKPSNFRCRTRPPYPITSFADRYLESNDMAWLGLLIAAVLIVGVLVDAFEVVLLPRRVRHSYRLARLFYRTSWIVWRSLARLFRPGPWRQGFLSVFGPLSLFALIVVWAAGLIIGF